LIIRQFCKFVNPCHISSNEKSSFAKVEASRKVENFFAVKSREPQQTTKNIQHRQLFFKLTFIRTKKMQFFIVLAVLCLVFTQSFAANCDANSSEKSCMAAKDSAGAKCSWCKSAAVGATCFSEADAKSLPASIYDCEYQKVMSEVTSCDAYTSESKCMSGSVDGEKCSWCKSAAVGATCFKESDAKSLPSSIYACEYQKYYLRA
jgi:hypothetical protein